MIKANPTIVINILQRKFVSTVKLLYISWAKNFGFSSRWERTFEALPTGGNHGGLPLHSASGRAGAWKMSAMPPQQRSQAEPGNEKFARVAFPPPVKTRGFPRSRFFLSGLAQARHPPSTLRCACLSPAKVTVKRGRLNRRHQSHQHYCFELDLQ